MGLTPTTGIDNRVQTRRTYGHGLNQILQLDMIQIPTKLESMTVRGNTLPYQGSGERTSIDVCHGLQDPHDDEDKEGICYINAGSFLITLVIKDRMPLLQESAAIIWDIYGVLPVYAGQITTGEYAYSTLNGKKRPLAEGTSSEGSRPRI